jgi:2-ketocyclohexanecarboxyl-CoA hydrolase
VQCRRAARQLDAEIDKWCAENPRKSPTAISIAKASFNAATESIRGIGSLGFQALSLYYQTRNREKASKPSSRSVKPQFRKNMK